MQKIRITNQADEVLVEIEGIIGVPEQWQFDEPSTRIATYEKFREEVEQIRAIEAKSVRVEIRSTGGDVNDAMMICEALRSLDAEVTTCCYGYTASAATIVAQAASEGRRKIYPNALYLIHKSSCAAEGNAEELAATMDMLRKTDERIAALYASRSGREVAEFETLMAENGGKGRWLSPEEALERGLVDEIVSTSALKSVANTLTRSLRNLLGDEKPTDESNVFHVEKLFDESVESLSEIALDEGQRRASATETLPAEDSSFGDEITSPNARAYADDARRIAQTLF